MHSIQNDSWYYVQFLWYKLWGFKAEYTLIFAETKADAEKICKKISYYNDFEKINYYKNTYKKDAKEKFLAWNFYS